MEKTFSKAKPLLTVALVAVVLLCSLMLAACGKQIKELQIDLRDVETTIIQGETFDYSNLKVNVYYDDDTSETVDTTSQDLSVDTSQVNTDVVGTYTVTVEYKGAKGIFNVNVISAMLLVDHSAIPASVPYGSTPNWNALVVQFYNESTGEYDTLTSSEYTLDTSNYNSQEYGTYWIKVTYLSYEVSFSVEVAPLEAGDAQTVQDGDTTVIFNNYVYNLRGGSDYQLYLADNETLATDGFILQVTGNGVTEFNISENGDYVLHYTNSEGVPTERKFRSVDWLTTFGTGTDWNSYLAAVAALGTDDSDFLNPTEQPYLVGTGNAFHFDLSMMSAGPNGANIVASEDLLNYTFYVQNGEDWDEVADASSLVTVDGQDFTFLNGADNANLGKVYRVVVTPKYQQMTSAEFVFTLNDGVNVFTSEELSENFSNVNIQNINIHRNIIVTLGAEQFNPNSSIVNLNVTNSNIVDAVDAAGYADLTTRTRDDWVNAGKWIIYNTDGTLLHNYTSNPYVRYSNHKSGDKLVVNGNYFNVNGGDLPLINPTSTGTGAYASQGQFTYVDGTGAPTDENDPSYAISCQISLFLIGMQSENFSANITAAENQISNDGNFDGLANTDNFNAVEQNVTTFNNISITANGILPAGDLNNDDVMREVSARSGSYTGIRVRSDLVTNNVNIGYASMGIYGTNYAVDSKINYTSINNIWGNGIFYYRGATLDMSNTYVGACGGVAVWLEDNLYRNGGIFDPYLIFDDTVTIDNFVSATQPWFVAYGIQPFVSAAVPTMHSTILSLSNNEKDFLTTVSQEGTDLSFEVFNFALAINNTYTIPTTVETDDPDYPTIGMKYRYNVQDVERVREMTQDVDPRVAPAGDLGNVFAAVVDEYSNSEAFTEEMTSQATVAGTALATLFAQIQGDLSDGNMGAVIAAVLSNRPSGEGNEVAASVYKAAIVLSGLATGYESMLITTSLDEVAYNSIKDMSLDMSNPSSAQNQLIFGTASAYALIYQSFANPDNKYLEAVINVPTVGNMMIMTEFFDANTSTTTE